MGGSAIHVTREHIVALPRRLPSYVVGPAKVAADIRIGRCELVGAMQGHQQLANDSRNSLDSVLRCAIDLVDLLRIVMHIFFAPARRARRHKAT